MLGKIQGAQLAAKQGSIVASLSTWQGYLNKNKLHGALKGKENCLCKCRRTNCWAMAHAWQAACTPQDRKEGTAEQAAVWTGMIESTPDI